MATLTARYSTAVHARSLKPDPRSVGSDLDVLGAYGLADRQLTEGYVRTGEGKGFDIKPVPLAVPLERFFSGDRKAAHSIVEELARMAVEESWRQHVKLGRASAHDMACACLAWHTDGRCRACGGHGYEKIKGTTTLGIHECGTCKGAGKIPFEQEFPGKWVLIARFLVVEMERASGIAGQRAMSALAKRMDL